MNYLLTITTNLFYVPSSYRPPASNWSYLKNLCLFFSNHSNQNPNVPIWISGDLNLSNINWETNTISGYSYIIILATLDFIENYGISQIVNTPARRDHILDIFLTDHPTLIQSCIVLPGISDHEFVHVVSSVLVSYCRPISLEKLYYGTKLILR